MTLTDRINDALELLTARRDELAADVSLADNPFWRDALEGTGYQVSTLLATDDDD